MQRLPIGYLAPPRGSPTQTAAARSGVYPANQAARYSSAVPVLAAAGRPMPRPAPVPSVRTPRSTWLTASATPLRMAWRQSAAGTRRDLPAASVIDLIAIGEQYLPRAPNAAYAAAIRTGETSLEPSVSDGTCLSGSPFAWRMPSRSAMRTVSHRPTFFSRARKNVLTEWWVPVRRLKRLPPSPSAALLSGFVEFTGSPAQSRNPVGTYSRGAISRSPKGMSSFSAAASVKTLKVDPEGMPRLLPWDWSAAKLIQVLPRCLSGPSLRS